MIHLFHRWHTHRVSGNFAYRECTKCSKRSIKVVDNLSRPFGGKIQYQWLEGKALYTKDDRAMMYPNHPAVVDYMWNKNKGE